MQNKGVFIGLSSRLRPDKRDGFHTVYSLPNGIDLSGVEIAATAFANLLEGRPLRRHSFLVESAVVFTSGLLYGTLCYLLPTGISAGVITLIGGAYLTGATLMFKVYAIWYPVVLPLFFQPVSACFSILFWKYYKARGERRRIEAALENYLPGRLARQIAANVVDIKTNRRIIDGTCLLSDAGQFTSLSETLNPSHLSDFMRRYYQALFQPVKDHDGIVINIVGDEMLALWESVPPGSTGKALACGAAIEVAEAASHFNQHSGELAMPVRIGIDSGPIVLGSIGALDHYEYRPTGSAVNTASRLEELNKMLNTRLLVSEAVRSNVDDGFLFREAGFFLLRGKTAATLVFELICRSAKATAPLLTLSSFFASGLAACRQKQWGDAIALFNECLKISPGDGPSLYYRIR